MKKGKVMNIWAKISSIVISLFSLVTIALYSFAPGLESMDRSIIILSVALTFLIFYVPLFYFSWSKKIKSRAMKIWAKVVTILLPILVILNMYTIITNLDTIQGIAMNILNNLFPLILIIPLYYYAWKNLK